MRKIEATTQFKKDYKREKRGQRSANLERDLKTVLDILCEDAELSKEYKDHRLSGEWREFRDCHVRPDLILIYCKRDPAILQVVRLGSHSELNL